MRDVCGVSTRPCAECAARRVVPGKAESAVVSSLDLRRLVVISCLNTRGVSKGCLLSGVGADRRDSKLVASTIPPVATTSRMKARPRTADVPVTSVVVSALFKASCRRRTQLCFWRCGDIAFSRYAEDS